MSALAARLARGAAERIYRRVFDEVGMRGVTRGPIADDDLVLVETRAAIHQALTEAARVAGRAAEQVLGELREELSETGYEHVADEAQDDILIAIADAIKAL